MQVGQQTGTNWRLDDLFWQSGAATGAWLGDIRCYTRMPASDQSVTFSRTGTRSFTNGTGSNVTSAVNRVFYSPVTLSCDGTISGVTFLTTANAYTGNIKCSIYSDNAGTPGTVLASATNVVTNPTISATASFTFSAGIAVSNGQKLWIAFCTDSVGTNAFSGSGSALGLSGTTTYASFPVANPTSLSANTVIGTLIINPSNSGLVNEPQQDSLTSFVYDSNPGDADFYGVGSIASTPATVIATVTRAYMQKSDAGTRTAAVQLEIGSNDRRLADADAFLVWLALDMANRLD